MSDKFFLFIFATDGFVIKHRYLTKVGCLLMVFFILNWTADRLQPPPGTKAVHYSFVNDPVHTMNIMLYL